ncbi:hypothetical protein [uncultured Roseibium sp.]|uniref:hypothetical protein n=1 Tax=uncultured Roseibium sp. TaxID=1936171 RepID=UPI0032166D1F
MSMLWNENPNYLSGAGLVWDIAGAYLLGRGLLVADKAIMDLAKTKWSFSASILRSECEHRLDTKFGLGLLIFGFLIQALASAWVNLDLASATWLAFLVVVPLGWLHGHYQVWVLMDTFRALETLPTRDLTEEILRKTFADYPERIWKMAVINSDFDFARPDQKLDAK